jgi:hypothetical protein
MANDEFANDFAEKKAVPSMVITDEAIGRTPDEMSRIRLELEKKFQGKQNAGKIMYWNGANAKATIVQLSQKDMQFVESKLFNRQAILSLFGVPPTILGIPDNSNLALATNDRINYYMGTINPYIKLLSDTITHQFIKQFDKNLMFARKMYVMGNIDDVRKMLDGGIITPNRAAELLGEECEEDDESRNTYYMASTQVPVGMYAETPTEEAKPTTEEDSETEEEKCSCEINHKQFDLSNPKNIEAICHKFEKSAENPKRFQVKFLRKALKSRAQVEDKYTFELDQFFEEQKNRVIDSLKQFDTKAFLESDSVNVVFDINNEAQLITKKLKQLYQSGIQKGVNDINELTSSSVTSTVTNPYVAAQIEQLSKRQVQGVWLGLKINDTTQSKLKGIISDGVTNNLSINDIQKQVKNLFDNQIRGYRARMIARTESRAAWDAGAIVGYKEIGTQYVDVVGCTQFEVDSDCGKQNVPIGQADNLQFHPNHGGCIVPSKED